MTVDAHQQTDLAVMVDVAPVQGVVEQLIIIGIVGTHSTGKSAFIARLAHELRRQQTQVATVADLGEQAQRMGMPILHNHTWASTLWIITRGISNELEAWLHADVVLVDRAVPDALGYYLAALEFRHERADPAVLATLEGLVRAHSSRYNLLFRTTLDLAEPRTARGDEQRFRELADHHVGGVLDHLGIPHQELPSTGHDEALNRAVDFAAVALQ